MHMPIEDVKRWHVIGETGAKSPSNGGFQDMLQLP